MRIKVFGADFCAGCKTVKEVLKSKGVEFVERDVNNIDHMEEAQLYKVRSIPTIVVEYQDTSQHHTFVGVSKKTIDDLLETVGV